MVDLLLALAHHFLIFTLAACLVAEAALLRPGLNTKELDTIGRIDMAFGAAAVLILIIGTCRVFFGIHGPGAFLPNPWFWAKMVAFAIVGGLSAPPTIRFLAWRKRARSASGFVLTADDVGKVRRFIVAELGVFILIPLLAAAMVRVPYL